MHVAGRSRVPLVVAALVGIVAVVAVRSATGGGGGDDSTSAGPAVPEGCVLLQVSASSEKAALLGQIAAEYAERDGEADGTCARV